MDSKTLSVCMIVKNEEQYLDDCLSTLTNNVDEIILADTGSTDQTIEIARKHGAKILEIEWINDFSYARNISISNAAMDWILVLDADEIIPETEIKKIYQIIQNPSVQAYQIIIRNMLPPGEIIKYNQQPALRLFRNHMGFEYQGTIHESVQTSILESGSNISISDVFINHYGYAQTTTQGDISRGERNLSLLLDTLQTSKNDPYIHYQIGITYKHLNNLKSAQNYLKSSLSNNKNELSPFILSDVFLKLAQIASIENNGKSSIKYAQKSIQNNPNNLIAVYLLSVQLIDRKQYKEAIPHLQRLLHSEIVTQHEIEDIKVLLHYCLTQK